MDILPDDPFNAEVLANFETPTTIAQLLDHISTYMADFRGLNIAEEGWEALLPNERILNYTYGFGLLRESVWPTFVLEALRADYLGAPPEGLFLSANKPHITDLMSSLGFLCPRQHIICEPLSQTAAEAVCRKFEGCEQLVLKPAYEESSVGLSLVPNEPIALVTAVANLYDALPISTLLVQEYVEGIDVTVPIIGRALPNCLPAVALQHDVPRVGAFVFTAELKATKASVHYEQIGSWPEDLRRRIYDMALNAFRVSSQRDYARLDCRVTPDGRCVFIEINANPQLGLDKASFAVSGRLAGLEVGEVVRRMFRYEPLPYGPSPLVAGL